MSVDIYGPDAEDFRPERWLDGNLKAKIQQHRAYASWAPQLSFLGGPRYALTQGELTDD